MISTHCKRHYIVIFLLFFTSFNLSCTNNFTHELEASLVTDGLSNREAFLEYEILISDLIASEQGASYYKIYQVTLDNGLKERRGIVVIDKEVFYIGSLQQQIDQFPSDIQFFNIDNRTIVGLYLHDSLANKVQSVAIRRNDDNGIISWSSGSLFRSSRAAIVPLANARTDPPWTSIINLSFSMKDGSDISFDFNPEFNFEELIVNVQSQNQ